MEKNFNQYISGSVALKPIPAEHECALIPFEDCITPQPYYRGKHARQPLFDWMVHSFSTESIKGVSFNGATPAQAVFTAIVFMVTALSFAFFGA
ncbi:MAG: hypothetical protein E7003_04990 [Eggerthellaceae bacterium]|nr:hypothetical protein [Eggerthellaceae bacterium]